MEWGGRVSAGEIGSGGFFEGRLSFSGEIGKWWIFRVAVEFQRGDWKVAEFFEGRLSFSGEIGGIEVEFEAAANFWLR